MQRDGEIALGRVHVGIDRAGRHIVDGDVTAAQVARQALHQPGQRRLAHGIYRAAGERHALGIGTADVDDAPTLVHVGGGGLGRHEDGAHVDGDGFVEIGQRELFQRAHAQYAGAVDQDVQPSEALGHAVDGLGQRGGIGGVGPYGQGRAAGSFDFRDQRFGGGGRGRVTDGDRGAFAGQAAGGRGADAARTAVDESNFTVEMGAHDDFLSGRVEE